MNDNRVGVRYVFICRRFIRHYRTGKIIFPKNGRAFCFWVKVAKT